MPTYTYKYIKEGREQEETKEFPDKGALYASVRAMDGSILSVKEVGAKKSSFVSFSFRRSIKAQEIITFAKNLAVMIEAGLSVSRALSVLAKQAKNKSFVSLLEDVIASVNSGETLSKSLESRPDVFSGLFVSMVKAGEESGQLSNSLKIVADQLEKSATLTKKIKGAMVYPAIIISLMVVIGILLMVYMVPTLTETFKGLNIELPLPTRIIIAISEFLRANIIWVLLALVGGIFGIFSWLKSVRGRHFVDFVVLHMPLIRTMARELNAARTSRTLSSLISSGVDLVNAIGITAEVLQNHYFQNLLGQAAKDIQTGDQLSACLAEANGNLYPIFVSEMLAVGEETGKMTEMLENIAVYYESEVDQKTKDLSTVIEPFLMILIGIAVGAFAIAMMLPTYSLVDAIQ